MMRLDRFTERAQDAAQRAVEIMTHYRHTQVDIEHIMLALLEQPEGVIPQILEQLGADIDQINQRLDDVLKASPKVGIYGGGGVGQVFITPRVKRVLDLANDEANRLKDDYISTEHLFLAIASERNTPDARILRENGVTKERIHEAVKDVRGGQRVTDRRAETRYRILEKFSRDLTLMARELYLLAASKKVEEIIVKIMGPQEGVQNIFKRLGFHPEAVLHHYVKDISGAKQDLVVMRCDLEELWQKLDDHTLDSDWQRSR